MNSIYGLNNSILDPSSDFYKWDKREIIDFNKSSNKNNVKKYSFNPLTIENNYKEKFIENNSISSGKDNLETNYNICSGSSDNKAYNIIKDLQYYDPVSIMFFSKYNINLLQKKIKQNIYLISYGKFIIEENQDDTDLLIVMRAIYLQEGRFLPNHIKYQVDKLNLKVINYIVPDMITNIKQDIGYQKEINQPLNMLDRPLHDNIKGRKTLPSVTSIWKI